MHTQYAYIPLISFIIPCYNISCGMMKECIESIIRLPIPHTEYEIIIVDDGSDIPVEHCLKEYKEKVIFIRQKNGGLSAARNHGIKICRGKYIQFIDGDDTLISQAYIHCIDIIKREEKTDIVFFRHFQGTYFNNNIKYNGTYIKEKTYESGAQYMLKNNLRASACAYLFKRKILCGLKFTEGILHEDEDFTPRLIVKAGKTIDTNATAYFYRQREASIMNNENIKHITKRLDNKLWIIISLNNAAQKLISIENKAMKRRIRQLTMDYIYNIMTLTGSAEQTEQCILQLRDKGMFPIRPCMYTIKYMVFAIITRIKTGRILLLHTLRKN